MFKKMQRRLTFFYAGIMSILVVLLIFGADRAMEWSITTEQEQAILAFADEEAIEHALFFQHGVLEPLFSAEEQSYFQEESQKRQMFFYVFNREGQLVSSANAQDHWEDQIRDKIANWSVGPDEVEVIEDIEGNRIMMAAQAIVVDGRNAGYVYVGRDVTPVLDGMENSVVVLGFVGLAALCFAVVAGYFMAQKAIEPLQIAYEKQRQFSADASHELRTPLAVILSSIEALQKEKSPKSDFAQHTLTDIKEETQKMAILIEELLFIARTDGLQELQLTKETAPLSGLVEEALEMIAPLNEEKKISIQYLESEPLDIYGDLDKLKRVLIIFLDNGIKYTEAGGRIEIRGEKQRTSQISIRIQDSGIGISKENQQKIFDRFYQADTSRSNGNGLGLPIANVIVEAHGGSLEVESELGKGSAFTILLPEAPKYLEKENKKEL